jgi:hypothetical protein
LTFDLNSSVPQRIPLADPDIPAQIHPESGNKIEDNRRAHGEETDVDKILANGGSGHLHFLTDIGTHPKQIVFYKLP